MKGVIFKAFEKFVVAECGDEFFEELLAATPAAGDGVFVGPGTYPDAVLVALLQTAVERLGVPADELLRRLGRFSFGVLAAGLPGCMDGHRHPLTFLEGLERVIHREVRKLYPEAITPRIEVARTAAGARLRYESDRGLCALLVGLLEGACAAFEHEVVHTHDKCIHRGDACCEFELTFQPKEVPGGRRAAATQAR